MFLLILLMFMAFLFGMLAGISCYGYKVTPYVIYWRITNFKKYLYGYDIKKDVKEGEYKITW